VWVVARGVTWLCISLVVVRVCLRVSVCLVGWCVGALVVWQCGSVVVW